MSYEIVELFWNGGRSESNIRHIDDGDVDVN